MFLRELEMKKGRSGEIEKAKARIRGRNRREALIKGSGSIFEGQLFLVQNCSYKLLESWIRSS